jgi:uncharacterized protein YkwD
VRHHSTFPPISRIVLALAVLTLFVALSGCAAVRARVTSPATASPPSGAEATVTGAVNRLRAAHHLPALATSPALTNKARFWAAWMAGGNCGRAGSAPAICHSSLTSGIDVKWSWLAENVGSASPASNLGGVITGFERSAGHAANILSTRATMVGVGVAYSGNNVYVVEEFMRPG